MILTTPPNFFFENRFNRRNYTCRGFEKEKKVNRKRGENKLQKDQTTTERKELIISLRQARDNAINNRFPKTKFPRITTDRQTQINKRDSSPTTVHHQSSLRQPRIRDINICQHAFVDFTLSFFLSILSLLS